jgi:hypothetical protein
MGEHAEDERVEIFTNMQSRASVAPDQRPVDGMLCSSRLGAFDHALVDMSLAAKGRGFLRRRFEVRRDAR